MMVRRLLDSIILLFVITLVCGSSYAAKLDEKALEEEGRQVTMDFRDVEIGTVVKFIGELTGKNFVVDERVKGKVTVISPTKITVDEAYKVFESILEIHGYTTVPAGSVFKVTLATEARGKGITTRVGTQIVPSADADTMITQVIPIQYANVSDMKTLLTPLVSKESLLVAYQPTNTLIVTDALSNINRLLKILKEVDIPGFAFDLAVIPLQNAAAEVVAQELKTLFEAKTATVATPTPRAKGEEGEGTREGFKIIPDDRTNSLVVLASAQSIEMLKGIIAKLDQEVPRDRGNIHVYFLQHAVAEDLAKILTGMAKEAGAGGKGGGTAEVGKGGETAAKPQSVLGEKVTILADKATNSLVITASRQDYAVLEDVIKKLDIVRPQVYVEAFIAELSPAKVLQLGVEWNWSETPQQGQYKQYGQTSYGLLNALEQGALNGLVMGVSKGMITTSSGSSFANLQALMQFYASDSDVNVLSAPKLLTTDNQEAQIFVGEQYPYLQSSQMSEAGSTIQSWSYMDVGITMKITPHISQGTMLRLDVFAEIKSYVGSVTGLSGANILTKRSSTTSVVVEDGSTVVIGGLISSNKNNNLSKIPILGNIPLLGWLFSYRNNSTTKTNLFIFLTPHIITSAEKLQKITEEEKKSEQQIEEHNKEQNKNLPLFEGGD